MFFQLIIMNLGIAIMVLSYEESFTNRKAQENDALFELFRSPRDRPGFSGPHQNDPVFCVWFMMSRESCTNSVCLNMCVRAHVLIVSQVRMNFDGLFRNARSTYNI